MSRDEQICYSVDAEKRYKLLLVEAGHDPGTLLAWEPFNPGVTKWFDETDAFQRLPDLSRRALNNVRLRDANSLEFYETAFGRRSQFSLPGITAIGFKLFPQHDLNLFSRLTTDPEVKVIVLERRNRFESFASYVTVVREFDYLKLERGKMSLFILVSPRLSCTKISSTARSLASRGI